MFATANTSFSISTDEIARVVCYFPYYSFQSGFYAENVKPELCTHIMYVYSGINADTFEMEPIEPAGDREESKRKLECFQLIDEPSNI